MRTPTGSRWMSNNYITRCHRRLELLEFELQFSSSRSCPRSENQLQTEGLGPQDTGWAAQQNEEEVLLWSEELGVNMWQFVLSPTELSHITNINPFATLSRIKCERYFFSKEVCSFIIIVDYVSAYISKVGGVGGKRRCPWCNGHRRRKWTRRHEFKSWTRLIAFHIALIPLGKVWIQLLSLQLCVNNRADWFLQPWLGNYSRRRKNLNSNLLNSA